MGWEANTLQVAAVMVLLQADSALLVAYKHILIRQVCSGLQLGANAIGIVMVR